MGAASSIQEQRNLYQKITNCLKENVEFNNQEVDEQENVALFDKVKKLYQEWVYHQTIRSSVINTLLVDFEGPFEKIFQENFTPLILDESEDSKIITFFSYQHTAIIDGKKLVTDYLLRKQPLIECLNYCRLQLVNAMKHGKLLVIHLGNSAPDFMNIFNDEQLMKSQKVDDPNLAYFPKEVFYEGGNQLKSNEWVKRLFREEDMLPHKNFAICR